MKMKCMKSNESRTENVLCTAFMCGKRVNDPMLPYVLQKAECNSVLSLS